MRNQQSIFTKSNQLIKRIMSKYLVTYHNAQMPNDPKLMEQAKMAFGKWLQEAGSAVIDPGAPVMFASQVAAGSPAPKADVGGYSIIEAANDEDLARILKAHPFVSRGGTLQASRIMTV
jgi:hypothetical protein